MSISSKKFYIGLDTSAYTTSIGVIDDDDNIILNEKIILKVKDGEIGLRQQNAIFQHLNNIPILIDKMLSKIDTKNIEVVTVSVKPRNIENSYMPVFNVGRNQGYILSKILKVKFLELSHQEGHIGATMRLGNLEKFLVMHLSGGTTELLEVSFKKNMDIDIIGGSKDLNIGQLIDRIGIKLGLNFPSGKLLEELSLKGSLIEKEKIKINIDNTYINLSGIESQFYKIIENQPINIYDIAFSLFYYLGKILEKITLNAIKESGLNSIFFVGGVSSNEYLRKTLLVFGKKNNIDVFFPKKELATDNGVGLAYLGKRQMG